MVRDQEKLTEKAKSVHTLCPLACNCSHTQVHGRVSKIKQKTCILSICVCVLKYMCVCLYDYAHIYTSIDTHTLCSLLLTVHCACRNDGNTLQKYNCSLYIIVFVTIL